jgi:CHAT domain-containing protein
MAYTLPSRTNIEKLALHAYGLMTERNRSVFGESDVQRRIRISKADDESVKAMNELGRVLLGPIAPQLGSKRLIIVPSGALQIIPFGALSTDDVPSTSAYSPLLTKYEIVSVPSGSTLAALRQRRDGRKPAPKAIAVLADPVFEDSDPRLRVKRASRMGVEMAQVGTEPSRAVMEGNRDASINLPRLLSTQWEAEQITSSVHLGDKLLALGFDANNELATSDELSQYRILHFATHAFVNDRYPDLSKIALSMFDRQGRRQEGWLKLQDVYKLNLSSDLVVLSACSTALGQEVSGEGLIGLTRGFMTAGASRVVASLWAVDGTATANLMSRFYKKMLGEEKLAPLAALRAAQVEMWENKRWKPPYFWAAITIQGEWR